MKQDWHFQTETYTCDLRVAGVLIRNGSLLVQRDTGGTEYALPGGHVQIGETTMQALLREWQEEMNTPIVCEKLLWTEECFWQWQGKQAHNLSFYYLVHPEDDAHLPNTDIFVPHRDNAYVEVGWLPIDELSNITIYPDFIKECIHHLDDVPSHHITFA